ncbi:LysR family transcriptional regulator [Pseudomonas ogarae]|uniref:LysR family transcriptional regulator n=1 Tax=Pseudomonas TaxID=286 RepID=UPI000BB399D7|nr:LysR family transcriptional regulator [Pseudomonas ogarae]PBJ16442.1 HTH-type transcriptional regulator DmlR [Pseudomonas ogarae]
MQLTRANFGDFIYFLAVARHSSFSRAGVEVGISASALSHAIKGLEARLGVRLLNRTTRSVTLTAAGEELLALISEPVDKIDQAIELLNKFRDEPTGRIRLNVFSDAALLLLAPVLSTFAHRYPDIEVEVSTTNSMVDIVEGGFDAGIRYGATVPEGMIAQSLSPSVRWVVVATPDYLDRCGMPLHPEDLKQHSCLRFRLGNGRMYNWEFEKEGEKLEIPVSGNVVLDETRMMLAMVTQGAGLTYCAEPIVAPLIAEGTLQVVLEDWVSVGPGFHIYYSSYRQVPITLRLLIDLIRELRPLG